MPYYGAIENTIFEPQLTDIASITNSFPAVVTTTFPHNYESLLIIRFLIPPQFGMIQLNKLKATITVTGPTTFTVPIDTTNFDPFVTFMELPGQPLITPSQVPSQVTPVGESASILTQSFVNILTPQF